METKTKVQEEKLNAMIINGKGMEAFESFYDDNVTMEEPRSGTRKGKAANREFEKKFFDSVDKIHSVKLVSSVCEGDDSFSEWKWDISFKDGKRVDMEEVAHRHWKNGRVVHEKFYYDSKN